MTNWDNELMLQADGESTRPWQSTANVLGEVAIQPRRVERLESDEQVAWRADLSAWVGGLISTYRLSAIVPPCWPKHLALVEELTALWLAWTNAWESGMDPSGPTNWHYSLDLALGRIQHRWVTPCGLDRHIAAQSLAVDSVGEFQTTNWWPTTGEATR